MSSDDSDGEEFVLSSAIGAWEGTEPSSVGNVGDTDNTNIDTVPEDLIDPRIGSIMALVTGQDMAESLVQALAQKFDAAKLARSARRGGTARSGGSTRSSNVTSTNSSVDRILERLAQTTDQPSTYRTCRAYDSMAGMHRLCQERSRSDPLVCAERVVKIALAMDCRGSIDELMAWIIAYMQGLLAIQYLMLPLNRAQAERVLLKTSDMEGAYSKVTETQFNHIFGGSLGCRRFRRVFSACRKILRIVKAADTFGVVALLGLAGYTTGIVSNWSEPTVKSLINLVKVGDVRWTNIVNAWPCLREKESEILSMSLKSSMIKDFMLTGRWVDSDLREGAYVH